MSKKRIFFHEPTPSGVPEGGRTEQVRSERGASMPAEGRAAVVPEGGRTEQVRSERGASMPAEGRDAVVLGGATVVLWHGAGGDVDDPHILKVARDCAAAGAFAARARFDYRLDGKKMPDRMPKLIASARASIEEVVAAAGASRTLILGGRSMGGRVASMLVAEGFAASGLIFLSYPLHPAGQPEKLRDAHLYDLKTPMLFVTGDRDNLAKMELLTPVLDRLGDRARLALFPGADHGFRRVDPAEVAKVSLEFVADLHRNPS